MFLSSLPSKSPLSCLSSLFPFLCSFLPFFIIYFFPLLLPWFSSFSLHSLLPVEVFPFSLLMCLSSFLLPSFYFFSLLFLVPSVFSVFFVTLLSSRFHFLYSLCCLFLHLSPPILLLSLRLVFSFLFVTYIFHRLLSFVLLFHCIYSCRLSVLSLALSFLSSCLSPLMVSFSFYSFPGFFLFSFLSYLL